MKTSSTPIDLTDAALTTQIRGQSQQVLGVDAFRCWGCGNSAFYLWRSTARCVRCRAYYLFSGESTEKHACPFHPYSALRFGARWESCRRGGERWPAPARGKAHLVADPLVIEILIKRGVLDARGHYRTRPTAGGGSRGAQRYADAKMMAGRDPSHDYRRK